MILDCQFAPPQNQKSHEWRGIEKAKAKVCSLTDGALTPRNPEPRAF
jgi:hypothetical protein